VLADGRDELAGAVILGGDELVQGVPELLPFQLLDLRPVSTALLVLLRQLGRGLPVRVCGRLGGAEEPLNVPVRFGRLVRPRACLAGLEDRVEVVTADGAAHVAVVDDHARAAEHGDVVHEGVGVGRHRDAGHEVNLAGLGLLSVPLVGRLKVDLADDHVAGRL